MEGKRIKRHERFYLDVIEGGEAWLEVDWNDAACQHSMLRIGIRNGGEVIVKQDDLETVLLALTKDPSRYIRSNYRKVGVKYVPVPQREYQEYKKQKERYAKRQTKDASPATGTT